MPQRSEQTQHTEEKNSTQGAAIPRSHHGVPVECN